MWAVDNRSAGGASPGGAPAGSSGCAPARSWRIWFMAVLSREAPPADLAALARMVRVDAATGDLVIANGIARLVLKHGRALPPPAGRNGCRSAEAATYIRCGRRSIQPEGLARMVRVDAATGDLVIANGIARLVLKRDGTIRACSPASGRPQRLSIGRGCDLHSLREEVDTA
jgi:hypothetical protein